MKFNNRNKVGLVPGVVAAALLAAASVNAAESREATPGYSQDSSNNVIRTDHGDCLRTGGWSSDKASIVGLTM